MHEEHKMTRQPGDHRVPKFDPTKDNAEAIARLEEEALRDRSFSERISDTIVRFIGTIGFVTFHILLFAVWCIVNLNLIPDIKPFDPFPFGILTLVVSSEGVLLALFILISQKSDDTTGRQAGSAWFADKHACRAGIDDDFTNAAKYIPPSWFGWGQRGSPEVGREN